MNRSRLAQTLMLRAAYAPPQTTQARGWYVAALFRGAAAQIAHSVTQVQVMHSGILGSMAARHRHRSLARNPQQQWQLASWLSNGASAAS